MELIRDGTEKWLGSYALRLLGGIEQATGKGDVALVTLRNALRLSTSAGDLHGLTLAQVALAEAHFAQGGYDQAKEYLELAQGRLKEEKSRSLFITGLIQRLTGQIEAMYGHYAVAKQHIAQSISIFTTTEVPYEAARSRHAMGLLLAATGEKHVAEAHLVEARNLLEQLGAEPVATDLNYALERLASGLTPLNIPEEARARALGPDPGRADSLGAVEPVSDRNWTAPASQIGPVNDVLLMQRLIEASASKELLLQELASVVHENFPLEFVVVFRADAGSKPEALVSKGISLQDATVFCSTFDSSAHEVVENSSPNGIIHLSSMSDGRRPGGKPAASLSMVFRKSAGGHLDYERLQPLIRQVELGLEACSLRAAAEVVTPARTQDRVETVMPGFIVASPPMFEVVAKIHKIRTSDVTVLITGESGTGKELVARALHAESARARAIFLPFNCTATPRDLIESQLFGHRRGAFTGATTNYPGMVRAAEGGTLFLDEIGDVALEVQPKLMRFLQEGEIQPLGETRPVKVDVRVVAATNSDLERAVEEGRFREDLFHRLNIIRIHVPPLRERRDEIPALASFFLDHFASRSGKPRLSLSQDAMQALTGYEWPGNVRQLRNEIERVTAYASDGARVSAEDLTPDVANGARRRSLTPSLGPVKKTGSIDERQQVRSTSPPLKGNGIPVKLKDAVAELEGQIIKDALVRNRNNVSRTAFELGLSRRGLRLKLAQLGIDKE